MEEDLPRPPKETPLVGMDLSRLSVDEITERIALLRAEIERLEQARAKKEASLQAANAAFKL